MIQEGLLWFCDDDRPTADKIARAVQRYQQKYGHVPTVCYVHPSAITVALEPVVAGVRVMSANTVLPYHFWLGVEKGKDK